mmetsp:Transcript_11386/g.23266  ORF Transcript_11386/g.23266 Transcript_11386/m.23266 type:complete len:125 (+) Transcript_11386:123-497(+)
MAWYSRVAHQLATQQLRRTVCPSLSREMLRCKGKKFFSRKASSDNKNNSNNEKGKVVGSTSTNGDKKATKALIESETKCQCCDKENVEAVEVATAKRRIEMAAKVLQMAEQALPPIEKKGLNPP